MDSTIRAFAEAARGFMPIEEGDALYQAGVDATSRVPAAPLLEIGSYCGKSSIYLGAAAAEADVVLFAVDHHRGSEENQAGWEWHEPDLVDPAVGRMDTLPLFRRNVFEAGLEKHVIATVADAPTLGRFWTTPLALLFIDGGHGAEPAHRDYELWTPFVAEGGLLAIHDVFPDPNDGGRPPFEIYERAIASENFTEVSATGSLRVLERLSNGRAHNPERRSF